MSSCVGQLTLLVTAACGFVMMVYGQLTPTVTSPAACGFVMVYDQLGLMVISLEEMEVRARLQTHPKLTPLSDQCLGIDWKSFPVLGALKWCVAPW